MTDKSKLQQLADEFAEKAQGLKLDRDLSAVYADRVFYNKATKDHFLAFLLDRARVASEFQSNEATPPDDRLFSVDIKFAPFTPSAWSEQVGGNHYKGMAIQPMTFSMRNNLNALQHTIIKYVARYPQKNGLEDVEKAKHCIDLLIEDIKAHGV